MITSIKKGGISALIWAIILVVLVNTLPLLSYLQLNVNPGILSHTWILRSLLFVMVILQATWFQRVMHNARFFEQWSMIPWVVFAVVIFQIPEQYLHFDVLFINFIWLLLYQKLFYQNDEIITNPQIFMDTGILLSIAFFIYPKSIFLLPFLFISLNQFAASDLNRFYIVLLSFVMVAVSTLAIGYFFVSPEWVINLPKQLKLSVDFPTLLQPKLLYTYIIWFSAILILIPVTYNQLQFMQTKNRMIINMLYFQLISTVVISFFSGNMAGKTIGMAALPLAFIIAFAAYHIKNRWIANLGLLFLIFSLLVTQWYYM